MAELFSLNTHSTIIDMKFSIKFITRIGILLQIYTGIYRLYSLHKTRVFTAYVAALLLNKLMYQSTQSNADFLFYVSLQLQGTPEIFLTKNLKNRESSRMV